MNDHLFFHANFVVDNRDTLEEVREAFAAHLRGLKLRYRSECYYPEAGWSTPAYGEPLEVFFSVKCPKDEQCSLIDLAKTLGNDANKLKKHFPGILKISTQFVPFLHPR